MIDAEQTYFQEAIDNIVTDLQVRQACDQTHSLPCQQRPIKTTPRVQLI